MSSISAKPALRNRAAPGRCQKKSENNATASAVQALVNLQELARFHLGAGMFGGEARVYILPEFDPDHSEYHFHPHYFRNPVTGDRGSAITFICRIRRCGPDQALAYLAGWLDARAAYSGDLPNAPQHRSTPVQLALFSLSEGGRP